MARRVSKGWLCTVAYIVAILSLVGGCGTPTARPTPSPSLEESGGAGAPGSQNEVFKIVPRANSDQVDVLQEVFYATGGGDGFGPHCLQKYDSPTEAEFLQSQSRAIELPRERIQVQSCGWSSNEPVHITLQFPDGRSVSQDARATLMSDDIGVYWTYPLTLDDPPGVYVVTFKGQSGTVIASRQVIAPSGPRVLWCPDSEEDRFGPSQVWLYGFGPGEHIRLLAYGMPAGSQASTAHLVDWQELAADERGQVVVRVEPDDGFDVDGYAAIGDTSGEARDYRCWGDASIPRLGESVLYTSYVRPIDSDSPIEVQVNCWTGEEEIRQIPYRPRLKVVGSARRLDDSLWWSVVLDDGTVGCIEDEKVIRVAKPIETWPASPANETRPEDILEEAAYVVAGGGDSPVCPEAQGPVLATYAGDTSTGKVELGVGFIAHYSCGWKPKEMVKVTLEFPDGRSLVQDDASSPYSVGQGREWTVGLRYQPSLDDPPGLYRVTFKGKSGLVEAQTDVVRPAGPRLLYYLDNEEDWTSEDLFLYNFAPGETIRLIAYAPSLDRPPNGHLIGWQEFQADKQGELRVRIEGNTEGEGGGLLIGGFGAVGSVSGEAESYYYTSLDQDAVPIFGRGLLSYFVGPKSADDWIQVRADPSMDARVLENLHGDVRVRVISIEPIDTHDHVWLKVRLDSGQVGWIAEPQVVRLPNQ